jgi:hypothetical protein
MKTRDIHGERASRPEVKASFAERNRSASAPAPLPWLQAAEAVMDLYGAWYGTMVKLAFGGFGQGNRNHEAQGIVTARPPASAEGLASRPVTPLQSAAAPVVPLRPKRRKSSTTATSRSRSSKSSGGKRSRRAA